MKDDPRIVLGKAVRAHRNAFGWSQEALAERAGLHWTYIGGVERGERNIALLNITAIARALKIKPSDLLKNVS